MLNLTGKITPKGWVIGEPVTFAPEHTGGHFSDCYYVERKGVKAFLKALDIEKFEIGKVMSLLQGFQYESELLELCQGKKLGRIVQVLESDHLERGLDVSPVLRHIPFLVFELAAGDIRETVDVSKQVSDQWRFHVLHQTTLALMQLHGQAIAHQDLKPSNVLRFANGNLKLGDLGRSSLRGKQAPHDGLTVPGARNYAPFELRYSEIPRDWVERRLSTDVFHLGCLTVFAFTNICFPQQVMEQLPDPYQPANWGAPYVEVLPHIQAAATETLAAISSDFPDIFRSSLMSIISDLCNPDPKLRGRVGMQGKNIAGQLWLQRYVSKFDLLEKNARLRMPVKNV